MNKQDKVYEVDNLKAKIEGAKLIALADYTGITVAQVTQLREKVVADGGELQVVKNRLFTRALRLVGIELKDKDLTGTTMVLFSNLDEIAPLRALSAFAKSATLLPFKLGYMTKQVLSVDELNRYALLPTREQLNGKLVSLLIGPQYRLVYGLKYNLNRLVLVLNAVKNTKSN